MQLQEMKRCAVAKFNNQSTQIGPLFTTKHVLVHFFYCSPENSKTKNCFDKQPFYVIRILSYREDHKKFICS